jgi:hypothetical protein
MRYYKNKELADEFGVSLPTVANWIKDTLAGKKDLELVEHNGKTLIARTYKNLKLIREYVSQGFKYKPLNTRVLASPRSDYIKYFSDKQLIELKKDLVDKKQLDIKYSFIGGGAMLWNKVCESLGTSSMAYGSYHQMNLLAIPIIISLSSKNKINLFEIGTSNGKALLAFLKALDTTHKLNSYIAIDMSREVNKTTTRDLKKEFPNLNVASYVFDVENESFEEVVYELYQDYPDSMNIFILYGGTFGNFSYPEKAIMNLAKSMMSGDLLCINNSYPHVDQSKDFKYMYESPVADHYLFGARALGIRAEPTNLQYDFDGQNMIRTLYLKVPLDHTLKFSINEREEYVDIPKGTRIKIWQHRMTDLNYIQNIATSYDLFLVLYTISSDNKSILTVHRKESLTKQWLGQQ